MIDVLEDTGDRLVLTLNPGGPIELTGLTESFSALARMYGRHYRTDPHAQPAPRLYVTRLESGSIIAEIAPYATIMGALVATMGGVNTIADFARRLSHGIKAFADPSSIRTEHGVEPLPSRNDAADIRAFVLPLTGKTGAVLNIRHARLARRETSDGDRHTIIEYSFDENELNRATVNIDQALSGGGDVLTLTDEELLERRSEAILREVMLFFEQASRKPGRERVGLAIEESFQTLPRSRFQCISVRAFRILKTK
jgi:hypothetical protein